MNNLRVREYREICRECATLRAQISMLERGVAAQGALADELRAEVARLQGELNSANHLVVKYIEEENEALKAARAEVAALKAKLALYEAAAACRKVRRDRGAR